MGCPLVELGVSGGGIGGTTPSSGFSEEGPRVERDPVGHWKTIFGDLRACKENNSVLL